VQAIPKKVGATFADREKGSRSRMKLSVNTILHGRWYSMGEEIPESIVPLHIRKYALKPASKSSRPERHLSFQLNHPYSVDADGYLRGNPAKQVAQMEAEVAEDEMIADEIAEAEVNETLASAIEEAREDHSADVERQKAEVSARAEQAEAAEEFVREQQEKEVKSGEFDQYDSVPDELTAVNSEQAEDSPQRAARRGALDASRKPDLKAKKKSYVRRGSKFVPASAVELVEGEKLYWFRKRKFGQPEKFIVFGRVERKANDL
jgi:hypothetical protein